MQGDGNKAQSSLLKNSSKSLIFGQAQVKPRTYKSQLLMNELFTTKKRFKQTPFYRENKRVGFCLVIGLENMKKLKMNLDTGKSTWMSS